MAERCEGELQRQERGLDSKLLEMIEITAIYIRVKSPEIAIFATGLFLAPWCFASMIHSSEIPRQATGAARASEAESYVGAGTRPPSPRCPRARPAHAAYARSPASADVDEAPRPTRSRCTFQLETGVPSARDGSGMPPVDSVWMLVGERWWQPEQSVPGVRSDATGLAHDRPHRHGIASCTSVSAGTAANDGRAGA